MQIFKTFQNFQNLILVLKMLTTFYLMTLTISIKSVNLSFKFQLSRLFSAKNCLNFSEFLNPDESL